MGLFCKHDWHVLHEIMLPSIFEQIAAKGQTFTDKTPASAFWKIHAVTLACKTCGKLRRQETRHP